MARYGFWIIAALVVVLDQWTKWLVQTTLPIHGPSVTVIPNVVYFTHVHNTGVAFGQFAGGGVLLVLAAAAAALAILAYRRHLLRRGEALHPLLVLGLAMPLGGAIGNMIDRVRLGEVVDFIDFRWWPVFNVADSAITLGAVALATYFLLVHPGHAEPQPASEPQVSEAP
jgi:signal peptidase II